MSNNTDIVRHTNVSPALHNNQQSLQTVLSNISNSQQEFRQNLVPLIVEIFKSYRDNQFENNKRLNLFRIFITLRNIADSNKDFCRIVLNKKEVLIDTINDIINEILPQNFGLDELLKERNIQFGDNTKYITNITKISKISGKTYEQILLEVNDILYSLIDDYIKDNQNKEVVEDKNESITTIDSKETKTEQTNDDSIDVQSILTNHYILNSRNLTLFSNNLFNCLQYRLFQIVDNIGYGNNKFNSITDISISGLPTDKINQTKPIGTINKQISKIGNKFIVSVLPTVLYSSIQKNVSPILDLLTSQFNSKQSLYKKISLQTKSRGIIKFGFDILMSPFRLISSFFGFGLFRLLGIGVSAISGVASVIAKTSKFLFNTSKAIVSTVSSSVKKVIETFSKPLLPALLMFLSTSTGAYMLGFGIGKLIGKYRNSKDSIKDIKSKAFEYTYKLLEKIREPFTKIDHFIIDVKGYIRKFDKDDFKHYGKIFINAIYGLLYSFTPAGMLKSAGKYAVGSLVGMLDPTRVFGTAATLGGLGPIGWTVLGVGALVATTIGIAYWLHNKAKKKANEDFDRDTGRGNASQAIKDLKKQHDPIKALVDKTKKYSHEGGESILKNMIKTTTKNNPGKNPHQETIKLLSSDENSKETIERMYKLEKKLREYITTELERTNEEQDSINEQLKTINLEHKYGDENFVPLIDLYFEDTKKGIQKFSKNRSIKNFTGEKQEGALEALRIRTINVIKRVEAINNVSKDILNGIQNDTIKKEKDIEKQVQASINKPLFTINNKGRIEVKQDFDVDDQLKQTMSGKRLNSKIKRGMAKQFSTILNQKTTNNINSLRDAFSSFQSTSDASYLSFNNKRQEKVKYNSSSQKYEIGSGLFVKILLSIILDTTLSEITTKNNDMAEYMWNIFKTNDFKKILQSIISSDLKKTFDDIFIQGSEGSVGKLKQFHYIFYRLLGNLSFREQIYSILNSNSKFEYMIDIQLPEPGITNEKGTPIPGQWSIYQTLSDGSSHSGYIITNLNIAGYQQPKIDTGYQDELHADMYRNGYMRKVKKKDKFLSKFRGLTFYHQKFERKRDSFVQVPKNATENGKFFIAKPGGYIFSYTTFSISFVKDDAFQKHVINKVLNSLAYLFKDAVEWFLEQMQRDENIKKIGETTKTFSGEGLFTGTIKRFQRSLEEMAIRSGVDTSSIVNGTQGGGGNNQRSNSKQKEKELDRRIEIENERRQKFKAEVERYKKAMEELNAQQNNPNISTNSSTQVGVIGDQESHEADERAKRQGEIIRSQL